LPKEGVLTAMYFCRLDFERADDFRFIFFLQVKIESRVHFTSRDVTHISKCPHACKTMHIHGGNGRIEAAADGSEKCCHHEKTQMKKVADSGRSVPRHRQSIVTE
jgi:hypothetical protein